MSNTILIIEDNENHRVLLENLLDDEGYQTQTAADGNEVKEKMTGETHFDLILVDIAVPEFNAIDFIKNNKDRVLVVSNYIDQAQGLLPDKQLVKKPFDNNELRARIKDMLNR